MVLYSPASPLLYICTTPLRSDKPQRSKNKDTWSERQWTMAHISQTRGDCRTVSCLQTQGSFCSKWVSRGHGEDAWKGQKHCLTVLIGAAFTVLPFHTGWESSDDVTVAEEVTSCRLFLCGLSYVTLPCPERHGQLPGFSCHVAAC